MASFKEMRNQTENQGRIGMKRKDTASQGNAGSKGWLSTALRAPSTAEG